MYVHKNYVEKRHKPHDTIIFSEYISLCDDSACSVYHVLFWFNCVLIQTSILNYWSKLGLHKTSNLTKFQSLNLFLPDFSWGVICSLACEEQIQCKMLWTIAHHTTRDIKNETLGENIQTTGRLCTGYISNRSPWGSSNWIQALSLQHLQINKICQNGRGFLSQTWRTTAHRNCGFQKEGEKPEAPPE